MHSEFTAPGIWNTTRGVVAGAGVEHRTGPVRVEPEVRYIRWNRPAIEEFGPRGFSIVSTQNQVQLMLGLRWP
jgi:hypothetical protein